MKIIIKKLGSGKSKNRKIACFTMKYRFQKLEIEKL